MEKIAEDLLQIAQTLKRTRANEEKDVVVAVHALAARVANEAHELFVRYTQECPGLYWRESTECFSRLRELNKTKKRRVDMGLLCKGNGSFDKGGRGPPSGDEYGNVPQSLCNVCYQTFLRDKRAGILGSSE